MRRPGWRACAGAALRGGRFAAYRVERRTGDEAEFAAIARQAALNDTVYTDESVVPDLTYFYRIVVEAAGRDWASASSGRVSFALAPVELLSGAADERTGTMHLVWSGFTGPGFQSYQVRRRISESIDAEILATITSLGDTSYVDETARADVGYVYTVVVEAADQALESNALERRLTLPPVQIQDPAFDAATATATLGWSRYEGPRFQAYQVRRSTEGITPQVVAEIEEVGTTSLVDRGLEGHIEYTYQVVVLTERGEAVASTDSPGSGFHGQVAEWADGHRGRRLRAALPRGSGGADRAGGPSASGGAGILRYAGQYHLKAGAGPADGG